MIGIKNLNRKLIPILFLFAITSSAFAVDNAECKKIIRFQSVEALSMDYLGWLARPISSSSGQGGVVFWPFDEESYPNQGDWEGYGVVLANTGDIDARSVGGVIWVRKDWKNRVHFKVAEQGEASIEFDVQTKRADCAKTVIFEIRPDRTVDFGGESVGRVKSIVE
jgi:hypothetical protein